MFSSRLPGTVYRCPPQQISQAQQMYQRTPVQNSPDSTAIATLLTSFDGIAGVTPQG